MSDDLIKYCSFNTLLATVFTSMILFDDFDLYDSFKVEKAEILKYMLFSQSA